MTVKPLPSGTLICPACADSSVCQHVEAMIRDGADVPKDMPLHGDVVVPILRNPPTLVKVTVEPFSKDEDDPWRVYLRLAKIPLGFIYSGDGRRVLRGKVLSYLKSQVPLVACERKWHDPDLYQSWLDVHPLRPAVGVLHIIEFGQCIECADVDEGIMPTEGGRRGRRLHPLVTEEPPGTPTGASVTPFDHKDHIHVSLTKPGGF